MKMIKIELTTRNKKYTFTHFTDENTVSINMIENGKHSGHLELEMTSIYKEILNLKQGQKFTFDGMTAEVTDKIIGVF